MGKQDLDSILWAEARYQFRKKNKEAYLSQFGSTYYEEVIDQDSTWSAGVEAKAKRKNISYQEMLKLDADYMFKKSHPRLFTKSQNIQSFEKLIRKDSLLLKQARKFANYYSCPLDQAIRYHAGVLLSNEQ